MCVQLLCGGKKYFFLTNFDFGRVLAALVENGKFLLAARKFRRATSTDYIISLNQENMSRGSNTYVGKLR